MTPIPPIPEESLASRLWREWNEYKAAAHATGIGGMDYSKWLIERTAKLRADNKALLDALKKIVDGFEMDYVIEGVVVDKPEPMYQTAYEIARAAIEHSEPQ